MEIREINLGNKPVLLAPMEDVTDQAFRLLCKEFGASMVYSEFVSADALIRNVNRSLEKIRVDERERPVAIQIYGRDVESMVEARHSRHQLRLSRQEGGGQGGRCWNAAHSRVDA